MFPNGEPGKSGSWTTLDAACASPLPLQCDVPREQSVAGRLVSAAAPSLESAHRGDDGEEPGHCGSLIEELADPLGTRAPTSLPPRLFASRRGAEGTDSKVSGVAPESSSQSGLPGILELQDEVGQRENSGTSCFSRVPSQRAEPWRQALPPLLGAREHLLRSLCRHVMPEPSLLTPHLHLHPILARGRPGVNSQKARGFRGRALCLCEWKQARSGPWGWGGRMFLTSAASLRSDTLPLVLL